MSARTAELELLELLEPGADLAAARGVGGELAVTLEQLVEAWAATLATAPQTQRTYQQAARRFLTWLGPDAGLEALTLHTMAAYQAHLAAPRPEGRRSSATIRKERAALNALLRWAVEHELISRQQGTLATSVRLPKAPSSRQEGPPKALDDQQYDRLLEIVTAQRARDRLIGARDLAIVRTLGDAGLRCEELASLERRDFLPARKNSTLRVLDVRFGKGDRQRHVKLTPSASAAIVAWERERTQTLGAAPPTALLFVTLGRRRGDGSYTRPGHPVGAALLGDLLKRYGRRAGTPEELQHPHVLRHTMATRWRRRGRDLETLRRQLGHASMKTTQIYLTADAVHEDAEILAFDQAVLPIETDAGH